MLKKTMLPGLVEAGISNINDEGTRSRRVCLADTFMCQGNPVFQSKNIILIHGNPWCLKHIVWLRCKVEMVHFSHLFTFWNLNADAILHSTVLFVDLMGTEIWRGLKAFATTSPRRGLKLESNIVESRVSLRPFISWTKNPRMLDMFEADLGKIPLITAGEHYYSIKIDWSHAFLRRHHRWQFTCTLSNFLSDRSYDEFWSIQTDAIFPNKKNMSILNQPFFVPSTAIHPRDQQARLVGFKACTVPRLIMASPRCILEVSSKRCENWYGEYPKYPW